MELKVKHIGYTVLGFGSAYLVYSLINRGFTFVAKYPRLYALVTKGESKTYGDYNFYSVSGLRSFVDGKGSKYPLINRPLTTYTIGQIKQMQAQARYGANGQLWATGRYQIIPSTLIYLQKITGMSDLALYSKVNQDRLANALIATKPALNNYLTGKVADTPANSYAAALAVSQIWSSVGQPSNNKSYYGENATTSTYDVQKVLKSYR
jgi:hypothetical protein